MCHFRAQNGPFVFNNFWGRGEGVGLQTIYFYLPVGPSYSAKFTKKFLRPLLSREDAPDFGPKIIHLPQTIFEKLLISFSSN